MTDPTPLRAGQIDVSVMTQGPRGQIEHNGRVTVCLRSLDERHSVIRAEATSSAATNKLLRMARIDVPQPGPWELTVTWAKNAQPIVAQTKVNIAEKPTGWHNITGWIAAPFVLIGLYAVGEILAARQSRRRPRHAMLNS
jgi:hypothetical protein